MFRQKFIIAWLVMAVMSWVSGSCISLVMVATARWKYEFGMTDVL